MLQLALIAESPLDVRIATTPEEMDRHNTKFVVLHYHEAVPHGKPIVAALESTPLEVSHHADLAEGARKATALYLYMIE